MGKQLALKECVVTPDYLDRFGRAVAHCVGDGTAQKIGEEEGKPIYKVDESILAAAMGVEFKGYRLGNHDPGTIATNDDKPFDANLALTHIRLSLRGEGRKPVMTVAEEPRVGTFMGRVKTLEAIGDTLAMEHKGELDKPHVMGAYMNEIEALPEVERRFRDSVAVATINTAVLDAVKAKAAAPKSPGSNRVGT